MASAFASARYLRLYSASRNLGVWRGTNSQCPCPQPVHVVAARLGHSDINTTWNVYSHVLRNTHKSAAEALGKLLHVCYLDLRNWITNGSRDRKSWPLSTYKQLSWL